MANRFERRPVVTLVALVAAVLLVSEASLRLLNPSELYFVHQARQVHRYSRLWGIDLAPSKSAHLRIVDRKRGGDLLNFILSTGDDGFRTPDGDREDRRPEKPSARFVHAVGDSYTMGWGVGYESSYPAILDKLLEGEYRVLNLGVDGYGALGATGKSMALSDRFPPAHAIYLFSPNDFEDDERALAVARRSSATHFAVESLDRLRRHSYLANVPFALKWRLFFEKAAAGQASALGEEPASLVGPRDLLIDPPLETLPALDPSHPTLARIAAYRSFLESRGARLLVLALSNQPPSLACYRFCLGQGIPSHLIELPWSLRLPGDGHFNPRGNDVLARLVRERIGAPELK